MAEKLTLFNNALILLGERTLTSLTENREARRLLDAVWARPLVDEVLQEGQWRFAMRTVELTESPSISPSFGYQYAFDRPDDLVRTAAVCRDEKLQDPLLEYQTEGQYWYADLTPIYVRYVSNDTSFGGDLSLWPPNFTRFVEAKLAEGIVERITQNEQKWARIRGGLMDALEKAKSTDAMEAPTKFTPAGSWVRARSSGGRWNDRGNPGSLIG